MPTTLIVDSITASAKRHNLELISPIILPTPQPKTTATQEATSTTTTATNIADVSIIALITIATTITTTTIINIITLKPKTRYSGRVLQ